MVKRDPTVCVVKWNEVESVLSTSIESGKTYDENKPKQSKVFVLPMFLHYSILCLFEREIHLINRDKTSKVLDYRCYTIGCKCAPLLSCLKQLIPMANTHDGALPVSLWSPWVTPLLNRGEGVCGGYMVLVSQDCDWWSVTLMETLSNLLCSWWESTESDPTRPIDSKCYLFSFAPPPSPFVIDH